MANRKYVTVECFEGEKLYINVKLVNLRGDSSEVSLRIDTGFDESILLDTSTYAKFSIGEIPESLWFRFKTLNGYLIMRTSKAILNVGDKKIETYVLTPRDFDDKNLIGL